MTTRRRSASPTKAADGAQPTKPRRTRKAAGLSLALDDALKLTGPLNIDTVREVHGRLAVPIAAGRRASVNIEQVTAADIAGVQLLWLAASNGITITGSLPAPFAATAAAAGLDFAPFLNPGGAAR